MASDVEELMRKRDQLSARIQQLEARIKANTKQEDDRVKVITGAWLVSEVASGRADASVVLAGLNGFLTRSSERKALLGDDGRGSEAFSRLFGIQGAVAPNSGNQVLERDKGCEAETKFNWRKEWALKSKLETPKNRLPRGVAEA